MKRILMAGLVMAAMAVSAKANWRDNPDKCISIGLSYSGSYVDGTYTLIDRGFRASQDVDREINSVWADMRIPVSRIVTLWGAIGSINEMSNGVETRFITGAESDINGVGINLGIRFYLH